VRGKAIFRIRDLKRAINAAREIGLKVTGYEIRPDGVIAVMAADTASNEPTTDLDQWMNRKPTDARSA
jgi:hypothetical protein